MLTFKDIIQIKTLFRNNQNVIQYIKSQTQLNAEEAILHSYDLQAGSYIQQLVSDQAVKRHKLDVGKKLTELFNDLSIQVVCEAGVGEATTLGHLLPSLTAKQKLGFDISMSRLLYAQRFLQHQNTQANLFCGELATLPFSDNAIECLYTFHSLEPNGGKEKIILQELLRVTKNYLILIEPDYDLFEEEQKIRMDKHGYCRNLYRYLMELGGNIIHYEPWNLDSYYLNKASIIIVEKEKMRSSGSQVHFVSPISHQPLVKVEEGFFCKEDGFLFPMVKQIPVFLRNNAILVSCYDDFNEGEV